MFICSYIFYLATPLSYLQTLYLGWLQTSSQCYDPISPTNSARSIAPLPGYPFNIFHFLSLPMSICFLTQGLRRSFPVFAILWFITVTSSEKTFWTIPSNYCLHFSTTCSPFSLFNGWFALVFDCLIHQNGSFNRRGILFDFPYMFMDTMLFLKLFATWREPPWHMLHDPDKHNGVITHLEPDILECEVKWALGSITTNKASGGDGIPVELFQILKDVAMKVLHSICQKIWKTQQWPQEWD